LNAHRPSHAGTSVSGSLTTKNHCSHPCLARGAGQKMVAVTSSDPQRVQCLAYRGARGITLWLANLSAKKQVVNVSGIRDATYAGFLDEASFVQASTDPRGFQATYQPVKGKSITLGSYAVAFLSIND